MQEPKVTLTTDPMWLPLQQVEHRTVNGKYRVQFEKAASAKGIIGIKCEANGDSLNETLIDAQELFDRSNTFANNYSKPIDITT